MCSRPAQMYVRHHSCYSYTAEHLNWMYYSIPELTIDRTSTTHPSTFLDSSQCFDSYSYYDILDNNTTVFEIISWADNLGHFAWINTLDKYTIFTEYLNEFLVADVVHYLHLLCSFTFETVRYACNVLELSTINTFKFLNTLRLYP